MKSYPVNFTLGLPKLSTTYTQALKTTQAYLNFQIKSFEDFLEKNPRRAKVYRELGPIIDNYLQKTLDYIDAMGAQKDGNSLFGNRVITVITVTLSTVEEEKMTACPSKSMHSHHESTDFGIKISKMFFIGYFFKELQRALLFNPVLLQRRLTELTTCSISIVAERRPHSKFSIPILLQVKLPNLNS
jgi:hypothetical protein